MADKQYSEIEVAELKRQLEGGNEILIIDVCNGDEFSGEKGHIPGARNVPFADMPVALEPIADAMDKPIAVNCGSTGRSERAADLITEAGFRHVFVIQGGLAAWREAGFEVA